MCWQYPWFYFSSPQSIFKINLDFWLPVISCHELSCALFQSSVFGTKALFFKKRVISPAGDVMDQQYSLSMLSQWRKTDNDLERHRGQGQVNYSPSAQVLPSRSPQHKHEDGTFLTVDDIVFSIKQKWLPNTDLLKWVNGWTEKTCVQSIT